MFGKKNLEASLDGLQIGVVGPHRLALVLRAGRDDVTLNLHASDARSLASALQHWADRSETIQVVRPPELMNETTHSS